MNTINDIAIGTEYNGKRLLDGTWSKRSVPINAKMIVTGDEVTEDGVYKLSRGFTGTVTVNAQNVKIIQEDPLRPLNNVQILGPAGGNANLWVEGLYIRNTVAGENYPDNGDKSVIKFQGANNFLTFKGNNFLYLSKPAGASNSYSAVIDVGGGLTVNGGGDGNAKLKIGNYGTDNTKNDSTYYLTRGAGIGGDREENSNAEITIGSGVKIDIYAEAGAGIGGGRDGSIGNINIGDGADIKVTAKFTSPLSGGWGAGIGSGYGGTAGDIKIGEGAKISTENYQGAGIGSGAMNGRVSSITVSTAADVSGARSDYGNNIGAGYSSPSITPVYKPLNVPVETAQEPGGDSTEYDPLWIQHGTQAGQRVHVFINSMTTKALGVDDTRVTTRDNALEAIDRIDDALEYALNEATTQGAYLQRLELTDSNVTIMGENVTHAESTIRDADMAREMTEYTKCNILTQSSQAMLAQANQNCSAILSLLQ